MEFRRVLFRSEAERGQSLARVIFGVRELWNAEVLDAGDVLALVDAGIEVDVVPARRTGRGKVDHHVALRVEPAGVPEIAVVVDQVVDIRRLGPADALE